MKKYFKWILMFVICLNLTACVNRGEKAQEIMLSELEQRYGEEFEIHAIGGSWGTYDDSTIKAYAAPVQHPEKEFLVTIKKDFSEVKDRYMEILLSEQLTTTLQQELSDLYPELHIYVHLTDEETVDGQPDADFRTYIDSRPFLAYVVNLFISADETTFDKAQEAQIITEVLERHKAIAGREVIFNFYYLKEEVYQKVEVELPTLILINDYYVNTEKAVNFYKYDPVYNPIHMTSPLTIESIVNDFKF